MRKLNKKIFFCYLLILVMVSTLLTGCLPRRARETTAEEKTTTKEVTTEEKTTIPVTTMEQTTKSSVSSAAIVGKWTTTYAETDGMTISISDLEQMLDEDCTFSFDIKEDGLVDIEMYGMTAGSTYTFDGSIITVHAGTGSTLELIVDKDKLYMEDSESGVRIYLEQNVPAVNNTPSSNNAADLTIDSTFNFDGLEITFGGDIKWATLENQYSEYNGYEVFAVPMTITNLSGETHGLNMFYYTIYGASGTSLSSISAYFSEDDVSFAGDMRSGASQNTYMYILYDGDGDYYVEFDNWTDKVEVKIPVTK